MLADLLTAPARQAATLEDAAHRPWPLPAEPWVMGQTWEDLLFVHWRVPEEALRPLVPERLELQTRDGSAWLGVTPFRISGVRLRGTLPLPYVSELLELNVRTYVSLGGRPGIWFLSLDASSPLAVEVARRSFHLPYHRARMSCARSGDRLDFRSARAGAERPRVWEALYGPAGEPAAPGEGTLEHFLTERYCLYAERAGDLLRVDIHHPPWPLQPGAAEIAIDTMAPDGIELAGAPLLHFSARQDVVVWPPQRVG